MFLDLQNPEILCGTCPSCRLADPFGSSYTLPRNVIVAMENQMDKKIESDMIWFIFGFSTTKKRRGRAHYEECCIEQYHQCLKSMLAAGAGGCASPGFITKAEVVS